MKNSAARPAGPAMSSTRRMCQLCPRNGAACQPGAYLARDVDGTNPGAGYVRVALVGPAAETEDALTRLRDCLYQEGS